MTKVDRYAVVGNPIGHSRSPEIHRLFAQATHQPISYDRLEGPLDGFEEFALGLRDTGYLGLNVTIPFKLDASKLADSLTGRARLAGAVNTLKFDEDTIYGDNTDGIGFVRDITHETDPVRVVAVDRVLVELQCVDRSGQACPARERIGQLGGIQFERNRHVQPQVTGIAQAEREFLEPVQRSFQAVIAD